MENKILKIHKAPHGFLYVNAEDKTSANIVLDTEDYPNNIDSFELVRVPNKEEHEILLRLLESRRV